MSCGRHTTRRQAHSARRAKASHTTRKAQHAAARHANTAPARKRNSGHAAAKKIRKIGKTRPSASKAPPPKRRRGRQMTARLKARNTAHKTASATARAHARAIARAKARAAAKAAAARRATLKTNRSHAKHHRMHCRVSTRRAALVKTPISPRQAYYRMLNGAYRTGSKTGRQSAYKSLKTAVPQKGAKAVRRMKAAKGGG